MTMLELQCSVHTALVHAADHPKSVVYTGYCTVSARIILHNPRSAARLCAPWGFEK